MEFALMTEPQIGGTYEELLSAALWAERNQLVGFARSDHYYSGQEPRPEATDAFATLAGLARDTESIRLTVLVSPITFRHPAVIAKTAVTIDQMSGGRLDLGVGTGWMDLEHAAFGLPFPEWAERFERFEESLGYLQAAFGDGKFEGRWYRLDADVKPKPVGHIPIIIGGTGPKRTPRLAGQFADEYNHFAAPATEIAPKLERVRQSALKAGRDPESITFSVMGPVLVGRTDAEYQSKLEIAAAQRGKSPDELEEQWSGHGFPMGTKGRVAEAFGALQEIGITKYYFQHLNLSDQLDLDPVLEVLRSATE